MTSRTLQLWTCNLKKNEIYIFCSKFPFSVPVEMPLSELLCAARTNALRDRTGKKLTATQLFPEIRLKSVQMYVLPMSETLYTENGSVLITENKRAKKKKIPSAFPQEWIFDISYIMRIMGRGAATLICLCQKTPKHPNTSLCVVEKHKRMLCVFLYFSSNKMMFHFKNGQKHPNAQTIAVSQIKYFTCYTLMQFRQ